MYDVVLAIDATIRVLIKSRRLMYASSMSVGGRGMIFVAMMNERAKSRHDVVTSPSSGRRMSAARRRVKASAATVGGLRPTEVDEHEVIPRLGREKSGLVIRKYRHLYGSHHRFHLSARSPAFTTAAAPTSSGSDADASMRKKMLARVAATRDDTTPEKDARSHDDVES